MSNQENVQSNSHQQTQSGALNLTIPGGWSPYGDLTPEDTAIFNEALQGFVGVTYTPISVSTQVVAGTNYRFKCTASIPPSDVVWEAIVEIYDPLDGPPHITGITRV